MMTDISIVTIGIVIAIVAMTDILLAWTLKIIDATAASCTPNI